MPAWQRQALPLLYDGHQASYSSGSACLCHAEYTLRSPGMRLLNETLAITAIGRHFFLYRTIRDQQQVCEAFA